MVATDVAERDQVNRLAARAVGEFGRIDTWVHLAVATEYATVADTPTERLEQQLRVSLLGQVYGVKAALEHMRPRRSGAIICLSSALGVRGVPLQAAYCASKAAIRIFLESLRVELEAEQAGISVTAVLPSSINTPLFRHAGSRLGVVAKPVPPVYEPGVVADSIVFAADHPTREIVVGAAAKGLILAEHFAPVLLDRIMLLRRLAFRVQQSNEPDDGHDNVSGPSWGQGSVRGGFGRRPLRRSPYTAVFEHHPNRKRLVLGAALAAAGLIRLGGRRCSAAAALLH